MEIKYEDETSSKTVEIGVEEEVDETEKGKVPNRNLT